MTAFFDGLPYVYALVWTKQNLGYVGCRYAKGCDPTDLWVSYFTSSKYVAEARAKYGEPDTIDVIGTYLTRDEALRAEESIIRDFTLHQDPVFLNRSCAGWMVPSSEAMKAACATRVYKDPDCLKRRGRENAEKARIYELRGQMVSASDMAKLAGVHITTIRYRLRSGMSVEEAATPTDRRHQDTYAQGQRSTVMKKRHSDPTYQKKHRAQISKMWESDEYREQHRDSMIERSNNEHWRKSRSEIPRDSSGRFTQKKGSER